MKYLVLSKFKGSMDECHEEFETLEKAVSFADEEYNHLCEKDLRNCEYYYILESVTPDEEADDHLDGNIIKSYK